MAGAPPPSSAQGDAPAKPFGQWERSLASRYLRTKRKNGGVALISWISFGGITVAVAALIIVMSVMNGFRTELLGRMLGFNGHVMIQGPAINGPGRENLIARVRAVPGVTEAVPLVEAQGVAIGPNQLAFAIVRGMRPADVKATRLVSQYLKSGSMKGFGEGRVRWRYGAGRPAAGGDHRRQGGRRHRADLPLRRVHRFRLRAAPQDLHRGRGLQCRASPNTTRPSSTCRSNNPSFSSGAIRRSTLWK